MSDINVIVNDEIVNIDVIDEPVLVNVVNSPGVPGAPGQGVPVGGTTGQVLKKLSNTNYDTYWAVDAGGISSIGLTMPSAFAVANSPLTANGTLAVTATGDTTQYIAGDGSLVAFPITGQAGTLVREVRNVTGATLLKGTVVYINGASGNKPTVAKAIATSDATSAQTFGLIQADIPNNSNGYLVAFGDLDGLDTSAFADGVQLYLSSTVLGGYTSTKQYAPAHLVYIGVVTRSHPNQGRIEVRIQNGYEMDELHDVAAQNPNNNDGLFYNSTTSLWEHKQISTALGYTPANAATTLTINGVTFDLSANRSWTVAAGISGSGASGQVAYWTGASAQSGSNNLFWDATNSRLGVGTNTPAEKLHVAGNARYTGTFPYFELRPSGWADHFYLQAGVNEIASVAGNYTAFLNTGNGRGFSWVQGTGSGSAKMLLTPTTFNLLLGSTTDTGERLQVTGSTKLNGNVTFSSSTGMFWDATNSRLGIGTNAPQRPLHIYSNSGMWVQSPTGGNSILVITPTGFDTLNQNFIDFSITANSRMRLFSTGNLALGSTSDSGERLQVTGGARITGSGNTSSTFALTAYNSSGNILMGIRDDRAGLFIARDASLDANIRIWEFAGGVGPAIKLSGNNSFTFRVIDGSGFSCIASRYNWTGIGRLTTTENTSAALQVDSTDRGFLPPRMTTTQKNAISSPAAGLVVYDTTLAKLCVYTTAWETITSV